MTLKTSDSKTDTMTTHHPPTALEQAGVSENGYEGDYEGEALRIRELSGATVLRLHTLLPLEAIQPAMQSCGLELPALANHSVGQDPAFLCLRPGEWLLFSEFLDSDRLLQRVRPGVEKASTALIDASDALATFRLSGAAAPWLLSKLSCLDFHSGQDAGQHCARTLLAKITAVIHFHQPRNGSSPFVFDLIFDRSVASYCWQVLRASAPHAEEMCRNWGRSGTESA